MGIPQNIQMVDLQTQYARLKPRIDAAMQNVIDTTSFIKGPALKEFENSLANYLGAKHVIGVANGTDSLQIALMACGLKPGDEVIVPAFTYVATAEVIGLLGLHPIMVDVYEDTFNLNIDAVKSAITPKTKAIVPVHLYGQSANMEAIMEIASSNNLYVIEDNAQAIGGDYFLKNAEKAKTGTLGHIGSTSFFPSKNLGCFGDGGALYTNSDDLAEKMKMIANHGQKEKYVHTVLGVNSRLDTLQAAVLNVKLTELDDFAARRRSVANAYNNAFKNIAAIVTPEVAPFSNHVYHQYTLKIVDGSRDELKEYLQSKGVPSMIYYPIPLYDQEAFTHYHNGVKLPVTEKLTKEVISLPIHTEMTEGVQKYIIDCVLSFYSN